MFKKIMNWWSIIKYKSDMLKADRTNKYDNWRAEIGGKYWTIEEDLRVSEYEDDYCWYDTYKHHMKLYFKTEEEAYQCAEKRYDRIQSLIRQDSHWKENKQHYPWYKLNNK